MIFVDSSVWIGYFNGVSTPQVERLDGLLGREPLVVGDIVVTEVLQGFRSDRHYRVARSLLGAFETVTVLGPRRARLAAKHYRRLRRRGITVGKTIDTMIATCCIDRDFWLLHADRDFEPFAQHCGLKTLA